MGLVAVLPVESGTLETMAVGSFFVWLVLWAYSPLPQGLSAPGHKERKRVWGFTPEYKNGHNAPENSTDKNSDRAQAAMDGGLFRPLLVLVMLMLVAIVVDQLVAAV
jgi:hypothetical protein